MLGNKELDIANKHQKDNRTAPKDSLNQEVMSPHDQNIVREKKKH